MKSLDEHIADFEMGEGGNWWTNTIGLPAILLGVLILLHWFSIDFSAVIKFSFAWILVVALCVYYFAMGKMKTAAVTAIVLVVVTLIITLIGRPHFNGFGFLLFLILTVGGLAIQFMHYGFEEPQKTILNILPKIAVAPICLVIKGAKAFKLDKFVD